MKSCSDASIRWTHFYMSVPFMYDVVRARKGQVHNEVYILIGVHKNQVNILSAITKLDMISTITSFYIYLLLSLSAYSTTSNVSSHFDGQSGLLNRAIPGLRGERRDCGIFRMRCATALGACNNGAFYQHCIRREANTNYTYQSYDASIRHNNRHYSGCEFQSVKPSGGASSVCKGENHYNICLLHYH